MMQMVVDPGVGLYCGAGLRGRGRSNRDRVCSPVKLLA